MNDSIEKIQPSLADNSDKINFLTNKSLNDDTPTTKSRMVEHQRNQYFQESNQNYSTSNRAGIYELNSDGSGHFDYLQQQIPSDIKRTLKIGSHGPRTADTAPHGVAGAAILSNQSEEYSTNSGTNHTSHSMFRVENRRARPMIIKNVIGDLGNQFFSQ